MLMYNGFCCIPNLKKNANKLYNIYRDYALFVITLRSLETPCVRGTELVSSHPN